MIALTGFATGIGSLPEQSTSEAAHWVVEHFPEVPHLVELPARGPWSGMIGRAGAFLPGFALDLTTSGWRVVPAAGADQRRIEAHLQSDIDALEDALAGAHVVLKTQVAGPWTLAAALEGRIGRRLLQDRGACRDLAQSLAEGVREHVDRLMRIGATEVIVQVDEPSIAAIRTGAGATLFSAPRVPDDGELGSGWLALRERVAGPLSLHSCAGEVPWSLLAPFDAVSIDGTRTHDDEGLGAWLDQARPVWWGALDPLTSLPLPDLSTSVAQVRAPFDRLGFGDRLLDRIALTPSCGLAGATPDHAHRIARRLQDIRLALLEEQA